MKPASTRNPTDQQIEPTVPGATQQQFPGSDAVNTQTRTPSDGEVPPTLTHVHSAPDAIPPAPPGFEIFGLLGRGGMGVVYHARQTKLNREVALKMILAGGHSSEDDRARFLAEAEAIAALNHPGIVQVYEFGTHAGQPYFAMEYCPGGSLAKQLNGTPLPPKDAASLVQKLAYAVHAAHEKGIVHRDLKPANVLLTALADDAEGAKKLQRSALTAGYSVISAIKVTDFGLAKRLECGPDLTGSGVIVGTASYMAPEQAMGQGKRIGPAADGYALGAILYELLIGRPPFRADNPFDTMLQVVNDDPVAVRQLQTKVPADLETICHKCLQKDPNRRYATAKELARDLGRWLTGEAIQARPVGRAEKTMKWARRRPAAAALIALSVLSILATVMVGFWIAQQQRDRAENESNLRATSDRERDRALYHEQLAKQQSARAESNFNAARDAVETFLIKVADERLRREPRTERLQAELLEAALKFYDRFLRTEDGANPAVRREAGWAYQRAGRVRAMLGRRSGAIAAYREATRLFAALCETEPSKPTDRIDQAQSLRLLAGALEADNQREHADKAFATAKELLERLVTESPEESTYRVELGLLFNNRGTQLASRRQLTQAIGCFRNSLAILDSASVATSAPKYVKLEAARSRANLGTMLVKASQPESGNEMLRAAVAQLHHLSETDGDPEYAIELGRVIVNLGSSHVLANQPNQALAVYRQAEAIFTQLAAKFPRIPHYRFELAKSHDNAANVLKATTGIRAAEHECERARALYRDLANSHPDNDEYRFSLALSIDMFGTFLEDVGRRDEAIAAIRESVALLQKLGADDPFDPDVQRQLGQRLVNLGILLTRDTQDAEAEKIYAQAARTLEDTLYRWPSLDSARKSLITAYMNQASLMKHLIRPGEEEAAWVRVAHHQTKRATDFPDQPSVAADLARTLYTLAELRIGRPAQAIATLRDAYDRQKSALALAPQRADLIASLGIYGTALVEALTNAGDHASALKAAERIFADLPQNWPGLPKIGGFLSQCVRMARDDKKLTDVERERVVKQCGTAALNVLRRAAAGGFKDVESLKASPEFAALRDAPEFKDEFTRLLEVMAAK